MIPWLRSRAIHALFYVGVIGKGIDGVLETAGGVFLFVTAPARIHTIILILTAHELSEDPQDIIANYLRNSTYELTAGTSAFAAAYLLWHGIVKIILVASLLAKRRWAYPMAIAAFMLFVIYQLYRYAHTHSLELLVLSLIDVFIILLTWLEYRRLEAIHGFVRRARA